MFNQNKVFYACQVMRNSFLLCEKDLEHLMGSNFTRSLREHLDDLEMEICSLVQLSISVAK